MVSPDIETEPNRSPARPAESINWTGPQRGAATIVAEVMNNSAEVPTVEPQALVATHEYTPASAASTEANVSVDEVAPGMLTPFFLH